MRDGWINRTFEDVFDLQMGKTPDRKNYDYFGGNNVWVSIRDLGNKEIGESKEHITDAAVTDTNIKVVPAGTVIMSFKLTVGKCAIAQKDLYTNEAIMAFNVRKGFELDSSFLYYYLLGYKWEGANKAVMGITLNKATISKQKISIPPLSIQQSIVAELDEINNLLSLKRKELETYDKLAQSLFYEMFGDPVENEKGWEVKKLGEICEFYNGKAHENAIDENGKYLLINSKFIASEAKIVKKTNEQMFPLYENDITMVMSDVPNGKALAKCFLIKDNGIYTLNQRICAFRNYSLNEIYFLKVLNRNGYFLRFNDGNGQTNLRKNDILNCPIHIPPLPLQQLFAERIEAIEAQKTQVKAAIEKLERLLAARMQYWFD